jgi:hypothetical protein
VSNRNETVVKERDALCGKARLKYFWCMVATSLTVKYAGFEYFSILAFDASMILEHHLSY